MGREREDWVGSSGPQQNSKKGLASTRGRESLSQSSVCHQTARNCLLFGMKRGIRSTTSRLTAFLTCQLVAVCTMLNHCLGTACRRRSLGTNTAVDSVGEEAGDIRQGRSDQQTWPRPTSVLPERH